MASLEPPANTILQASRNRHTTTQLCLVALVALLTTLVILTHNPEYEKPAFIITKSTLCITLLLVYLLEAHWMYE